MTSHRRHDKAGFEDSSDQTDSSFHGDGNRMTKQQWQHKLNKLVATIQGDDQAHDLSSRVSRNTASLFIDSVEREPVRGRHSSRTSSRELIEAMSKETRAKKLSETARALEGLGIHYSSSVLAKAARKTKRKPGRRGGDQKRHQQSATHALSYRDSESLLEELRQVKAEVQEYENDCFAHITACELLDSQIVEVEMNVDQMALDKGLVRVGFERPRYEPLLPDANQSLSSEEHLLNLKLEHRKLKKERNQLASELHDLKTTAEAHESEANAVLRQTLKKEVDALSKALSNSRKQHTEMDELHRNQIRHLRISRDELLEKVQLARNALKSLQSDVTRYSDQQIAMIGKNRVLKSRIASRVRQQEEERAASANANPRPIPNQNNQSNK